MPNRSASRASGFTIIELVLVLVLIVILLAIVGLTASGVRAKNRNAERQAAINTIQGQLEMVYALNNKYPTLAELNNTDWRKQYMKDLPAGDLQDPRWAKTISQCTSDGKSVVAGEPTANCYSYQVTATDGSACDNITVVCAHYTLTAVLEGGEKYVKSSLN